MIPSPTELHYFIEVSNTLNISRAAERLGITQPTLTLAMQRLEAGFGVPLLIRSKAGVTLTHAGRQFVSHARSLIHEWERVRQNALKEETEVRGSYTIGCHPSVARYTLPHFLKRMLTENPALEIKIVHDISRRITEDVISFKVDFGIVVNPWDHPDLVIKQLGTDIVSLWVSHKPTSLQEPLSGEGVLICDPDLTQSQEILKDLRKRKMTFKRVVTTSNLEVAMILAASGAGVGVLPGRVAGSAAPKLKPLMEEGPQFHDQICLVYRADAQRSKGSRLVAKFIESHCQLN